MLPLPLMSSFERQTVVSEPQSFINAQAFEGQNRGGQSRKVATLLALDDMG